MYAIIETGSKQYRVKVGDVIDVELLKKEPGESIIFDQVLLWDNGKTTTVGTPSVAHCIVEGELLQKVAGPKVIAYKYKRRKSYHKKKGHRQKYSRVKITQIQGA